MGLNRRDVLAGGTGLLAASMIPRQSYAQAASPIDMAAWSPEYVRKIAGTIDVDTSADCAKVVPLDYKGRLTFWYVGPNDASPPLEHQIDAEFWAAFAKTYPNITVEKQSLNYNDLLDKIRTAALGNSAPTVARLTLLWAPELAAKGFLQELKPEDVGYPSSEFWPAAMKSVTWKGKTYGIPTYNETMALIWNAELFEKAGLNPELPPATWDDLVQYSRIIKEKTGKFGYGMVARRNAGNTPYRFMPQCWAYGGGALDEAEAAPTYQKIMLDSAGTKAALQASYDMYVRDKSVPVSALTNTQNENQDPFVAGNLGMMIAHPSEYTIMLAKAEKLSGEERKQADRVVANMRYGLIPKGPARRAVVFGGWNAHIFKPSVTGGKHDMEAARALVAFMTGPEWSTKLAWAQSNPGNLRGFRTRWMKERLEQIKFLDVTTSMLTFGIPFPVIPESAEIMNILVPDMMQNALTVRMSVSASADNAAKQVRDLLSI
jgi:multiple sugar transport system substrate-binding protein